jgi:hypothetical protein
LRRSCHCVFLQSSRWHIDQLAQHGVIERRSDGLFDQDVSRPEYLTHLRSEHRRSPRAAADAEHALAKAALLRIRIEEKQSTFVRRSDVDALIDQIAGTVLTHLSGMSAALQSRHAGEAQHRRGSVADARASKVSVLIQINEALTQRATLGGRLRLSGATRSLVRRLEE